MEKYGIIVNLDDEKWLSNINFRSGGNWLRPYCLVTKATAGKYATALDNSNYLGRYGKRVVITIRPRSGARRLHSAMAAWTFCQITLASCLLILLIFSTEPQLFYVVYKIIYYSAQML